MLHPSVLLYITFCNIILAFWNAKQTVLTAQGSDVTTDTSSLPLATKKRRSAASTATSQDVMYSVDEDTETELNELALPEELLDSFLAFLKQHDIELKLFAGSWQTCPLPTDDQPYDVVLTSETVYEPDNLDSLCALLQRAATSKTTTTTTATTTADPANASPKDDQLSLVACKRVYFGVGGGELAFKDKIHDKAQVSNIWSSSKGVERTVMRIVWNGA